MAVGGQRHAPADLPLGNTRYPFYRRLGGPQLVCMGEENLTPIMIPSPDRPPSSESLHWLSYSSFHMVDNMVYKNESLYLVGLQ
jgi:hypothetical protein